MKVLVTYPGYMVYRGRRLMTLTEPRAREMWLHGKCKYDPRLCIVEDEKGMVHIVNKDIVEELP